MGVVRSFDNKSDFKDILTVNLEMLAKGKVLVVGSGGREHAIVEALSRSIYVEKIYVAPGNVGMRDKAECLNIKETDIEALLSFAKEEHISLTVVGPEAVLSLGIVDRFQAEGLSIFGPDKKAAMVESSKDFAKRLMKKHSIATAEYETFDDYSKALEYVKSRTLPIVLKYDGLAAGKGVVIANSMEEVEQGLKDMLLDDKFGKGKVLIEDYLQGVEFSYMCFVDGTRVFPLAMAQDHKRAFEGDKGPNTGGMGAYSPVPFITEKDEEEALEKIMKPMAAALVQEQAYFKGVLYGGLIKTEQGIKVIEFNCRFGDPETEVVLPRLSSDIYLMFNAIVDSSPMPKIEWSASVCLGYVLASKGYPASYESGFEIKGLDKMPEEISLYHMGTKAAEAGSVLTSGGRVLMLVAKAESFEKAKQIALEALDKIECENLFYRKDIAWRIIK